MNNKIYIFDTTLRDGEQSPGAKLNTAQKVELAIQLEKLGVDVIEAGFPISSPGEFQSVVSVGKVIRNAAVCALTRAIKGDIDAAVLALKKVKFPRIHTGIGASDIHIEYKFKSTREKILEQGTEAVKYAKRFVNDVEFYAEDAGRADNKFLAKMVYEVIKAGATVVNIPDTTGYCFPAEFGNKIKYLFTHVENIDKAIISVHCHNDLGLATANTLAGLENGARQAEVTINGIGERAGNTALEEVVMALYTRHDNKSFATGIHPLEIIKSSRLVAQIMGIPVQPNKAIVGANAFAHSSGIHQDGILKKRENYEIIDPKIVGVETSKIVLTARSGRAALRHRLDKLGINLTKDGLNKFYSDFLKLADSKKEVYEADLLILAGNKVKSSDAKLKIVDLEVFTTTKEKPHARVAINLKGKIIKSHSSGNGSIDACFKAFEACLGKSYPLKEFVIQAVSVGSDALARVNIAILYRKKLYWGSGTHTDTILAACQAYIDAVNKIL